MCFEHKAPYLSKFIARDLSLLFTPQIILFKIKFLSHYRIRGVQMSVSFKGELEKSCWKDYRDTVQAVNPAFANIIDKLDPDDDHWLLKVRYPYGSLVMQRSVLTLPNTKGDIVPITDSSIPSEIQQGVGYNLNSNPVSIVIRNSFEIYLPLENRTLPLSGLIQPGSVFGSWRILNPKHTEQPVFIWDMSAGARSVFMLPKITESLKHKKLIKNFGITASEPRSLMQHWEVFRQLTNSGYMEEPWAAEIIYFSESWFQHLDDPAWKEFYQYFYHAGWAGTEHWRNQPIWNLIFSLILKEYESKPNAYIMDTAKCLVSMGAGGFTGLGPALNNISGPWDFIQTVYDNVYEIRKYPPIIMQPKFFDMCNPNATPVYYSLQFPNASELKPSTRTKVSIISDLHEIRSLMLRYERDLLSDKYNLSGTSLSKLFNLVDYDYFHSAVELHEGMRDSSTMSEDINLRTMIDGSIRETFPNSCLFGKGCIRLAHKGHFSIGE